jgi:hypothetical protein
MMEFQAERPEPGDEKIPAERRMPGHIFIYE